MAAFCSMEHGKAAQLPATISTSFRRSSFYLSNRLQQDGSIKFMVLDDKQRLTTLVKFVLNGTFGLSLSPDVVYYVNPGSDKKSKQLNFPSELLEQFLAQSLIVVQLECLNDSQEYEVLSSLQQDVRLLNSQVIKGRGREWKVLVKHILGNFETVRACRYYSGSFYAISIDILTMVVLKPNKKEEDFEATLAAIIRVYAVMNTKILSPETLQYPTTLRGLGTFLQNHLNALETAIIADD